ncbi:MAG: N-acetylmuramoyl-L-alanine amidase, partial [Frankiales bacterium]|nr:N-acetylmuramoyl-L-alanine amidase [Frankiales bacterium]
LAGAVLLVAGLLADEHEPRIGGAGAEDDLRRGLPQRAAAAALRRARQVVERRVGGDEGGGGRPVGTGHDLPLPLLRRYVPPVKRLVLPLVVLLGLSGVPGLATTAATAATPAPGQSVFVPLEPVRLLDTRDGTGGAAGPVGAGRTVDLLVADGVRVPVDATAVVLNVTATSATAPTDVRVYPSSDAPPPTVSNLNVSPGSTVANLVHVKVGDAGRVRLRNAAGSVQLVADLSGYFAERGSGATYVPVAPRRLMDTREQGQPLAAGEVRRLQVAGSAAGAPADATAVVLNVTATAATRQTDVRVWPTRTAAPPKVSNLNPPPGRAVAAAVVVGVGDGGDVSIRSSAGSVQVLVDLAGWYVPTTDGSTFHPVAPTRLLDSRQPTADPRFPAGTAGAPAFRLGAGQTYDLFVAGVRGVPAVATAAVLNVTAVAPTAGTDLRVYPTGDGSVPRTSNLNAVRGQTVANTVVVQIGRDGKVRLRNAGGQVDLVVDLSAWFGPTGDGWDISWPQCTSAGATSSRLPEDGGFAVVGRTRGAPFTVNECFAAQWEWASSLPGEPSVYLNTDAPGVRDSEGGRVWQEVCGTQTPTSTCSTEYGRRLARFALEQGLPTTPSGGRPMVWLDVEGPYANGPYWQTGYAGAVGVNRGVVNGAVATLRDAGYRVGIYSDRADSSSPDWSSIMGDFPVPHLQTWVFRVADGETAAQLCGKDVSPTGGPVMMVQDQPTEGETQVYDVNHLC